jgi:hypothetical protein
VFLGEREGRKEERAWHPSPQRAGRHTYHESPTHAHRIDAVERRDDRSRWRSFASRLLVRTAHDCSGANALQSPELLTAQADHAKAP